MLFHKFLKVPPVCLQSLDLKNTPVSLETRTDPEARRRFFMEEEGRALRRGSQGPVSFTQRLDPYIYIYTYIYITLMTFRYVFWVCLYNNSYVTQLS